MNGGSRLPQMGSLARPLMPNVVVVVMLRKDAALGLGTRPTSEQLAGLEDDRD